MSDDIETVELVVNKKDGSAESTVLKKVRYVNVDRGVDVYGRSDPSCEETWTITGIRKED